MAAPEPLANLGGADNAVNLVSPQSGTTPVATPGASSADAKPPRCRPVVLCGPSGAGKSTLIGLLRKEFPDDFGFSVSHTTREPRPGERHGVDYYFVERAGMEAEVAEGKFLETAQVHGNLYGTSFAAVDRVCKDGRVCILDIDVQGVRSCRALGFDADAYVFIAPPALETLEARLRSRGTETEERLQRRLAAAAGEMEASKAMQWDAVIVNDDLEHAYRQLRDVTSRAREQCHAVRANAAAARQGELQ